MRAFLCRPFSRRAGLNQQQAAVYPVGGICIHGAASLFREYICGFAVLQLTVSLVRLADELTGRQPELRAAIGLLCAKYHSEQ